ncbi:hypothetical protein [Roseovarius sp. D0-M9]|uniref:hypothetical protein n=1 Tax=Roseovarius sp. D0-M9 TaxID=3127117 RepID=UPI00300FE8E5
MKHIITPIFVSAALCTSVPALAATDAEQDMMGFCAGALTPIDKNQDEKLSAEEIEAGATARFEEMDANKDGSIQREEYVKCMKDARDAEQQRAAEGEESGEYDIGEWSDISDDDQITAADYAKVTEKAWAENDEAIKDATARMSEETSDSAEGFAHAATQRFKSHDANGDGIITQQEYETPAREAKYDDQALERRFDDMDTDESGAISPQEYNGAAAWGRGALVAGDSADESATNSAEAGNGDGVSILRYYILTH